MQCACGGSWKPRHWSVEASDVPADPFQLGNLGEAAGRCWPRNFDIVSQVLEQQLKPALASVSIPSLWGALQPPPEYHSPHLNCEGHQKLLGALGHVTTGRGMNVEG